MNYYFFLIIIPLFFYLSLVFAKKIKLIDYPNIKRKIHKKPTLLSGGIFFYFIIIFYIIFYFFLNYIELTTQEKNILLIISLIVSSYFIIGVLDDLRNLCPEIKLISLFLTTVLILSFSDEILIVSTIQTSFNFKLTLFGTKVLFTTFCFIVLLNALNMSDGINCLSSMISIIWISIVSFFLINVSQFFFFLNILIIVGLVIFLIFNYFNKCFLGDSGCYVLSSYMSLMIIFAYNSNLNLDHTNVETIFLLFMIPGIDMIRLFMIRLAKRQSPFNADQDHLHHYLIKNFSLGMSLLIYFLLIILPLIILYFSKNSLLSILIGILCYLILLKKLNLRKKALLKK